MVRETTGAPNEGSTPKGDAHRKGEAAAASWRGGRLVCLALMLAGLGLASGQAAADEPPVALCGMEPYRLLPEGVVGELLEWEEVRAMHLPADMIDGLLEGTDLQTLSPVPWGARVFRYRYTTQDRGVPVEATALLGIPNHPNFGSRGAQASDEASRGRLPSFSWNLFLHGTTGFSDPCAPSASLEGQSQAALVASQGFIAVLPDYIGMNGFGAASTTTHGYLVGEQTAIGSWDALRAAKRLLKEVTARPFFTVDQQVVIWGASQGGHAALFTEHYGPYYAPEFQVAGVVASVPPSDLLPLVSYGFESLTGVTTLMAVEMVANQNWYGSPDSMAGVLSNTDPYYFADNANDVVFPQEACNPGDGLDGDSVDDLFDPAFIDMVMAQEWQSLQPFTCFWEANSLATSPVPALRHTPTLMQYSQNDELVIAETQRPDFDRLCSMGYQLQYLECQGARHTDGALWSLPNQIEFLRDRLAGEPMDPNTLCQQQAPVCCPGSPPELCTP